MFYEQNTNFGSISTRNQIIENAKQNGLYTIVTDSNTDWNFAPAKKIADDAWNISWSDIEILKNKCQAVGIKSIMAGFSEKRIDCAHKLAEVLSVPFFIHIQANI